MQTKQSFLPSLWKGHFGIECNNFDDTNLREINQFVEASPYIFTPHDSTNNGTHDKDDNHPLVADVDPKELINIVKFDLRKGKAPGHDTIIHELLRFATGTPFYTHLAKFFTFSVRIRYIHPNCLEASHIMYAH